MWDQIESAGTLVGLIAGVVSLVPVLGYLRRVWKSRSDVIRKNHILRGSELSTMERYLDVIENTDLLVDEACTVRVLKKKLAEDIVSSIVRTYSRKKYGGTMGRLDLLGCVFIAFVFLYAVCLCLWEWSRGWGSGDVWGYLFLMGCLCSVLFLVSVVVMYLVYLCCGIWRRRVANSLREDIQQERVPLSSMADLIQPESKMVFLDGTVRLGYEPFLMRQSRFVSSLMGVVSSRVDGRCLQRGEIRQVRAKGCDDQIKSIVQAYLDCRPGDIESSVFFVFSENGVTSVKVVSMLRYFGYLAYDLGASSDNERLLNAYFTELNILRACGLI